MHVAGIFDPRDAVDHPFIGALRAAAVSHTVLVAPPRRYMHEYHILSGLVGQIKPQILHTHGYHADIIGGAVAKARNIASVSTVHGFTGVSLRNLLYERVQLFALRHSAAVIAVSRPLVEKLTAAGVPRHRIHLVPNGFSPSGSPVTRLEARRRLGLRADGLVIGWLGRLSKEKGADVMLDAFAVTDPAWRLSLIGEGPEKQRLMRRVSELGLEGRVTWHGEVADAGSLLTAFDAFVLSSRTEGTPIVLLEAMAAEVAIVATDVGGVPDVVTPAEAILVSAERPAMIAQALGEIRRDPSSARQRADRARDRVATRFGLDAWLRAVEATYDSVASAPGQPERSSPIEAT